MIKFDFKLPDEKKFQEVSDETSKKILMKAMFKMEELAVNNAPKNDGNLILNISTTPQILSDVYVLTSKAPYSAAMEYGTRPYYAPIKPLLKWAQKKIGDEKAAYAVRAKIAKFGIKAQPFMRPALFQVKSYWLKEIKEQELSKIK